MGMICRWKVWAAVCCACVSVEALATDIVIKVPTGTGTAGVLSALKQARDARAGLPKDASGAIRVVFPPGEYPIFDTVVLTPADSGTAAMPTVLESEVPGKAVWVGALRLNDPVAAAKPAGAWQYSLAGIRHRVDARDGGQFFVGDQRAVLARTPNVGSDWLVQRPLIEGGKTQFVATTGNARELNALTNGQSDRAILHLMHAWTSGHYRIENVSDNQIVRIAPSANWPFQSFGTRQRYVIQNVPTALDAPGEWVEDRDVVTYVPRAAESRSQTAYLSVNPLLLQFKGRADRDGWVEHIHIKGLTFAYTYHSLMNDDAQQDWQAAVKVRAAVEISDARYIRIQDCKIVHTGGYGLWLKNGVQNVDVQRCVLQDLGAGGIKVGEADAPKPGRQGTESNRLIGNVISHVGQDFPGAVGIWIGHSFGNVVQGNVVANTTYTGISVGWQWGFGRPTSGDNQIRDNVLWNIGQGVMADLGGIYTLGRAPGTVIAGNYIRHVRGFRQYGAGAWGVYNDEGSSDMTIEGNVVIDAEAGAYNLSFGRDLTVTGNFFLMGAGPEINWSFPKQSGNWRAENNVLIPKGARALTENVTSPLLQVQGNLLGVGNRADLGRSCPRGCQTTTLMNVSGMGSDVAQIDIDGLPAERRAALRAVVQRAQQTVAQARKLTASNVLPQPGASTLAVSQSAVQEQRIELVSLDFANAPLGAHPPPLRYSPSSRLELIQVSPGEVGSSRSGNCLRFVDGSPDLAGFDPHVFLDEHATGGTLSTEFDVWVDSLTDLVHEWRDDSQPFKSGPILVMRADGISVGGRQLMRWKPQAWYRVRVVAPLGRNDATWELHVTADGKTSSWRGLPINSPGWNSATWIGWISQTTQSARTCLGSVKLLNE